jgi:TnpA family transposase
VRTIRANWEDMLRVAGSLTTGQVRAYDLIRMMQHDGRTTALGKAFAHYGRIFKTLHLLQFIDDVNYRRMIGNQLNIGESRHSLAREIAFGRRGHLYQAYKTGMEDQLSGLGLGLNAVVYWNSVYIDAAVKALEASGTIISDEIKARISPLESGHITFHGRYTFRRPELAGALRPLRDPKAAGE